LCIRETVNHICAWQWDAIAASFQREHCPVTWVVVIIKLPKNGQVIVKFICLGHICFRNIPQGNCHSFYDDVIYWNFNAMLLCNY
jgi:hypothetical protein